MKKKKLELKKETIANLNNQEMNGLQGGTLVSGNGIDTSCPCEEPWTKAEDCNRESKMFQYTCYAGNTCVIPVTYGESCPIFITDCVC